MADRVLVDLQLAARPEVIGFQRLINKINRELQAVNLRDIKVDPRSLRQTITQVQALRRGLGSATLSQKQLNDEVRKLSGGVDAINRFERALRTPVTVMGDLGRQTAITTRRFGVFLFISQGLRQVTDSFAEGVREAVNFNSELRKTTQLLSRGGLQLSGIGSVAGVQEAISRNARNLGADSNELIQVSNTLAQAGRSISEIRSIINDLSAASLTATFGDLGDSAENAQAILGQFRLGVDQLRPVLDSLNAVTKNYNVSIDELFTGLRKAGTTFAALSGVNENNFADPKNLTAFREFAAIFTSIIQTSRESADVVGTSLRTIIPRLQRGDTIDLLRNNIGVELRKQNGDFVGAFEAISRIADALSDVNAQAATFSTVIEAVGGLRQFNRALPLFENINVARDAARIQQESRGSVDRDVELALEDLVVQLNRVREEFRLIFREFAQSGGFDALADTVIGLARSFTTLANALLELGPLTPILGAIGAVAISRTSVGGFGSFGRQFGRNFVPSAFNQGGTVGRARLNAGGRPVALTPGEMVFTPDQINKIPGGYRTLEGLNSGRSVGNFIPPQGIGVVPGSGNTDSFFTSLPEGSFVLRKKIAEKILSKGFQGFNQGGTVGRTNLARGGTLLGGGIAQTQELLRANRELFREFARSAKAQGQDVKKVSRILAQNLRAGITPSELRAAFASDLLPGKRRQAALETFTSATPSEIRATGRARLRDPANQRRLQRNIDNARFVQRDQRSAEVALSNFNVRRRPDLFSQPASALPRLPNQPRQFGAFSLAAQSLLRNTPNTTNFSDFGRLFRGLGGPSATIGAGFLGTQLAGSNNSLLSGLGQTITGGAAGFALGGPVGALVGALGGATTAILAFQRAAEKASKTEFFNSVDEANTIEAIGKSFGVNSTSTRVLNNSVRLANRRGTLSRTQRQQLEGVALPLREQAIGIFDRLAVEGNSEEDILRKIQSNPRAFTTLLNTFSATDSGFRNLIAENPNISGGDKFLAQLRVLKEVISGVVRTQTIEQKKLLEFISSLSDFDTAVRQAKDRLNEFENTVTDNKNTVSALFGQIGGNFVGAGARINPTINNGQFRGSGNEVARSIGDLFQSLNIDPNSGFADLSRRQASLAATIREPDFLNFVAARATRDREASISQIITKGLPNILGGPNSQALQNNLGKTIEQVFGTDLDENSGLALVSRLPEKLPELVEKLGKDVVGIFDTAIKAANNLDRQFIQDFNRLNGAIVGNRQQLNQAYQNFIQAQDVILQLNGQRRSAGSANAIQNQLTSNLLGANNQGLNLQNRQSVLSVAQSLRGIINNPAVPANQRNEANLRLQGLVKALEANTNQTIRLSAAQERLAELQRTQQNARNFVAGLASGDPRAIADLNQRLRDLENISRGQRLPGDRFSAAIDLVNSATNGLRDGQFQQIFGIGRQGGQNNLQSLLLGRALGFNGANNRDFLSSVGQNIFAGGANTQIATEQARISQIFQDQANAFETLQQIQLASINETRAALIETNAQNTEALRKVFKEQLEGGAIQVTNEIKGEVQVTHNGLEVLRDLENKVKAAVESVLSRQIPNIAPTNGIP